MFTVGKGARATAGASWLALVLLAGCMAAPEGGAPVVVPADPALSEGRCGAAALQDLVGQDQAVLSGMRFAQVLRVFEEGQPVTLDYNPERLNIQHSKRGKIQSVTCG